LAIIDTGFTAGNAEQIHASAIKHIKAVCTLMVLTAANVSKVQFAAVSFHVAAHQLPANV